MKNHVCLKISVLIIALLFLSCDENTSYEDQTSSNRKTLYFTVYADGYSYGAHYLVKGVVSAETADSLLVNYVSVPDSIIFLTDSTAEYRFSSKRPDFMQLNNSGIMYKIVVKGKQKHFVSNKPTPENWLTWLYQANNHLTQISCRYILKRKSGEVIHVTEIGKSYSNEPLPTVLFEGDSLFVYNYSLSYR